MEHARKQNLISLCQMFLSASLKGPDPDDLRSGAWNSILRNVPYQRLLLSVVRFA